MITENDLCKSTDCIKLKDKKRGSAWCTMHRSRRSRYGSIDLPEKQKLPDGVLKICKIHGELNKENSYKVKNKNHYQCKICKQINLLQYEKRNPNRDTNRNRNYIFIGKNPTLRISIEEYDRLHKLQEGKCKICNHPETMASANKKSIKRLAIDHCHKTQKIRGLLCHHCNVSIGGFKESIETLESAINYLKTHNN